MSGNGNTVFRGHFNVFFPAIVIAALIVTIYHCIIVICRNSRQRSPPQAAATGKGSNIERFMVETHKYEKGKGFHDGECPVCLSEFEEGEEIRTLPECMHSYHVECIDMWLYSHPNCPMCRTNATPLPLPQVHGPSPMDARVSPQVNEGSRRLNLNV